MVAVGIPTGTTHSRGEVLGLAARVAGRAGGDVVQAVLLGGLGGVVGRDLAALRPASAAPARRPTGRRCGRTGAPPDGCRRSRTRRRRARREVARHVLRDLVLARRACSRDTATHRTARVLQPLGHERRARPRRPGRRNACSSQAMPSRRSSLHDVTDQTSAATPKSLASSSCASSAHGTPTPDASSWARGGGVAPARRRLARREQVHPAQDALGVDVLRLLRLHHRLVVDRHVVDDVLRVVAVHPAQPVLA